MKNYTEQFIPGGYYHIYNHAVSKELLFHNSENYYFFLRNLYFYINTYVDFYAYCLLPNHFHLLVKVKDKDFDIKILSENFRRFFIRYSQAIIKQNSLKGSLFMRPYKRVEINNEKYLTSVITYIHLNPSHHNICEDYENYKWSSYKAIISNLPSRIKRNDVLNWFDNKNNFIYYHKIKYQCSDVEHLFIE
jgi:putative transposase